MFFAVMANLSWERIIYNQLFLLAGLCISIAVAKDSHILNIKAQNYPRLAQ
jgi:hypothetical protein